MLLRCPSASVLDSPVTEGNHHHSPSFIELNLLLPNRLSCRHSLPSIRTARSESDLRSLVHSFAEVEHQHLSFIQEMEEATTSFSDASTRCLEEDGFIVGRNRCSNVSRKSCLTHSVPSAPSTSSQQSAPCMDIDTVGKKHEPLKLFGHGIGVLSKPEDPITNGGGGFHGRNGGRGGSGGSSSHSSNPQGDSNTTDLYYQRLLQSDPQNPLLLRNYAEFLREAKHDYKKAEEYYERAILACPNDGEVLSKYAQHLWDVHKDSERAGAYFDQAVNAAPDNCYVLASYASFLWESDECEDNADTCMQEGVSPSSDALDGVRRTPRGVRVT